jgi:hypothetical protein
MLETRTDVAHLVELASARRLAPALVEADARAGLGIVRRRRHAGADRLMNPLDLRRVEGAARIADEEGAGHLEGRHGLIAALDHGARTGRDDLAAFEQCFHVRVILVLLKCLEGLEARIFVVEADDEAHVHAIVVEVVQEAAAVGAVVERPAERVLDEPRLHTVRRHLPQLLEAEAIGLRRLSRIELEAANELLRGAAAAAFAEHGDLRVDLGAEREVGSRLAVLVDAHVADADPFDRARFVEQCLGCRETREHIDSELFRLGAQNRNQLSQRDDEVAVIGHLRRSGQAIAFAAGHEQEFVARRRDTDGGCVITPARQELIERPRLHDRAGQGMRTETRRLLEDADAQVGLQLPQANGACEARRTCADDRHLVLHDVTCVIGHLIVLRSYRLFAARAQKWRRSRP